MNSLPWPRPVAARLDRAAVQLDQAAHEREPDARGRPASGRASVSACANRSKTRGSSLGRDADAVVAHADDRPRRRRARRSSAMRPPVVGVLRGVVEQVGEHLREPRRVGVDASSGSRGSATVEVVPARRRSAGAPSRRRGHDDRGSSSALRVELDLAARDARDVEQVVDQPRRGAATWRSMTSRVALRGRLDRRAARSRCSAVAIGASGLRSSWASIARNSSLRRSASRRASTRLHPACGDVPEVADHAIDRSGRGIRSIRTLVELARPRDRDARSPALRSRRVARRSSSVVARKRCDDLGPRTAFPQRMCMTSAKPRPMRPGIVPEEQARDAVRRLPNAQVAADQIDADRRGVEQRPRTAPSARAARFAASRRSLRERERAPRRAPGARAR